MLPKRPKATKNDVIKIVADMTGNTLKVVDDVILAYQEVLRDNIVSGNNVSLGQLGTFKITKRKAEEERVGGMNMFTGKLMVIPAHGEYNKVIFKVSKPIRDELRHNTENNLFEE